MTKFQRKVVVGVDDDALIMGLHPKVHHHSEILEFLLAQAARRLRRQLEAQETQGAGDDAAELEIEIEPELVEMAVVVMKANNLPLAKLPKMILLVMEGYAAWRYDDMRVYIKRQILD